MKRILILTAAALVAVIIFSCDGFFLGSEPTGRINPDDPETTAVITGASEIHITSGSADVMIYDTYIFASDTERYDTSEVSFTIENRSSDTALSLTGSPAVTVGGDDAAEFAITAQPATSVAAGSTTTFTLAFSPLTTGSKTASLRIVNNDPTEPSYVIYLRATAVFTPAGTALADDFAAGSVTISEDSYLAPRDSESAALTVGGDITIQSGVTLTIYEGVTLDFQAGGFAVAVNGGLSVKGTDANRVKFDGSDWGGIYVAGTADINGAVIDGIEGGYALNVGGDDVTITNSRIIHSDTADGVRISAPSSNITLVFRNNIIVSLPNMGNQNQTAFDFYNFAATDMAVDISYNTIIGKGYGGYAIYISGSTYNEYTIERNIFANGSYSPYYTSGAYFFTGPYVALVNNIIDDRGTGSLYDGTADADTDNLEFAAWDNSVIFEDFDANSYRLKKTTTYPSQAQAGGLVSMEGCLTEGHANECGAYGDGGYPPDYNE